MKKNIRIFIVEDSRFLRKTLQKVFLDKGMEVKGVFSSGKKALTQIPVLKPDLVLIDMVLPGENGMELVNKIASSYYPQTKVLVCSSIRKEHIMLRSRWKVPLPFIKKPFGLDKIVAGVFSAVSEKEKEQVLTKTAV